MLTMCHNFNSLDYILEKKKQLKMFVCNFFHVVHSFGIPATKTKKN